MSRPSRDMRDQLDKQTPSSSRRTASTYQASRLPPTPSAIDGEEEVDLEYGNGSINGAEVEEDTPTQTRKSRGSEKPASDRFSFFGGNKNLPPPQPKMEDPETTTLRNYGSTPVDATHLVNSLVDQQKNVGPTETECTWAKILCLPGCGLFSAGSSYLGFILWLAAQNMKDIGATHIVCCSEAIAGSALACGCCLMCAGTSIALASKRR